MNDPLAISSGVGFFSAYSLKNKREDLQRIVDRISENTLIPNNTCKFPTTVKVINLEKRADRWENFQLHNQRIFEEFKVERFNALEEKDVVDDMNEILNEYLLEIYKIITFWVFKCIN